MKHLNGITKKFNKMEGVALARTREYKKDF